MPLVSVVIATYKRPERLLRAIDCALNQTMSDLEVVVAVEQDDPASLAVLESHSDPRVRAVLNPVKNGPGPARDTASRAAKGDYIAFLDDDDEWMPHKLERQLAIAAPDQIITCLSRVVTDEGEHVWPARPYDGSRPVDEWLFDRQSWLRGGDAMLQTSSLLVPTDLMRTLGFGSSHHEEWELIIRATRQQGYNLATVPEILVTYYAGGLYGWRPSLQWAERMHGILSPRAIAGFCLNRATQGDMASGRNAAFRTLLTAAFRLGRPTAKQLFAFAMIWGLPNDLRWRLRRKLRLIRS